MLLRGALEPEPTRNTCDWTSGVHCLHREGRCSPWGRGARSDKVLQLGLAELALNRVNSSKSDTRGGSWTDCGTVRGEESAAPRFGQEKRVW